MKHAKDKLIKKAPRRIIYAICVITLILILSESIIRYFNLAPVISKGSNLYVEDEVLPYKLRPLIENQLELWTGEFTFTCKHNRRGLRDVEHNLKKSNGTFRILALGDSHTYGFGADYQDTFLVVLEDMLNSRPGQRPQIEIIKAGIPTFYPELERMYLQEYGKDYAPDLITVTFLPHDIIDTQYGKDRFKVNSNGYLEISDNNWEKAIYKFLYLHSHVFRTFARRIFYPFLTRVFTKFGKWPEIYKKNETHEKNWIKVEMELLKIKKIATQQGAIFAVIYMPERNELINKIKESYPTKRLAEFCKNSGIFFIDTLPAFKQRNNLGNFFWKEGHYNKKGYGVIAETIFSKMLSQGLVP